MPGDVLAAAAEEFARSQILWLVDERGGVLPRGVKSKVRVRLTRAKAEALAARLKARS